jgi:hypothetical protein
MFENTEMMVSGPKKDEHKKGWRKLFNEEIHHL